MIEIPQSYFKNETFNGTLSNNIKDGIIGCGFLFKPDASYSQTLCFPHYGAFYLLSGEGYYEEENGNRIPLQAGDYVQRLPGFSHSTVVYPTGDWLEFYVCFGRETYEHLVNLNLLSRDPVIHPGLSYASFEKSIYLLECMKKCSGERQAFLYLQLQEFAMELYQQSIHKHMDSKMQHLMREAAELLCINPDYMSPHEVASVLNMGYESFRKKFKTYYKESPLAYQLKERINHSKTLLLDTEKSINEIALICHFSDGYAYSKAFKKHCGISPTQFRHMYLS